MPKNLLYFVVLSFSVVVSWILFGVYHNYTTSTISNDTNILITPISPSFDEAVINNILGRSVIPADLSQTISSTSAAPTPTPATIQTSTSSVQNQSEANEVSTPSAEL